MSSCWRSKSFSFSTRASSRAELLSICSCPQRPNELFYKYREVAGDEETQYTSCRKLLNSYWCKWVVNPSAIDRAARVQARHHREEAAPLAPPAIDSPPNSPLCARETRNKRSRRA